MEDSFIVQIDNFKLTELDFLIRLLVTTGIGFVIGLEREFSNYIENEEVFAGIRTFTLVALLGFLTAFLGISYTNWIFIAGFLSVVFMVGLSYWVSSNKGNIGGTTEFATIVTFLLGALILIGNINAGLALTVITVVILSLKVKLRIIIGQITQKEIYALIRFVVIALLILPFLPNTYFGTFNVINPKEIGWIIVLTSGIGFVGYMLIKFLGADKGILFTSIFGGLVSSTIVTYTFSKKSKETPELSRNFSVGIFAATSVMIIRMVLLVWVFNRPMLNALIEPLIIIFLTTIGVTFYCYKKQITNPILNNKLALGTPLNIKNAIFFGAFYIGILLLISYSNREYGENGIYFSSAISAFTDIDAIAISVSKLGGTSIKLITAQNAIIIATLANTVSKIGIAVWTGSSEFKKYVLIGYGIIFISGITGFLILN